MNKSGLWLASVGLITLLQLGAPGRVGACTGLACVSGAVLPESGGALPANAVEVLFRKPRAKLGTVAPEVTPHLYRLEGGVKTELEVVTKELDGLVHVSPQQPVAAGTALVFEHAEICSTVSDAGVRMDADGSTVVQQTLQVTPSAARPSTLGTLHADLNRGPVELTHGSMCSRGFDGAYADLSVDLDESAKPYADGLRYEVEVDGRRVEPYGFYHGSQGPEFRLGASQLGAAKDRLFTLCDPSAPAFTTEQTEGNHAVRMRARLPDDTEVWSDTVMVALRCDGADAGGCALPRARAGTDPYSLALVALLLGVSRATSLRPSAARARKP